MKRLFLVTILTCVGFAIQAQSMKVQSAISDFRNKRLDKAKTNIDQASIHDATKEDPKTWFYKAAIYTELAITDKDKFKSLVENPLDIALEAAIKCGQLDKSAEYAEQNKNNFRRISLFFFDKAADEYKAEKYVDAMKYFELVAEVNKYSRDNENTPAALSNAALSAQQLKDTVAMKRLYISIIRGNFKNITIAPYNALYRIYKTENDTTQGVKLALQVSKKFSKDFTAYLTLADAFFSVGEKEKAMEAIDSALTVNPENATDTIVLNLVGSTLAEAGETEASLNYYLKSLEINPNQFLTNYSVGVSYYNKAADLITEAGMIPPEEDRTGVKYNKLKNEASEYFSNAIPYLEKSLEFKSDNFNALNALRQIYARLENMEKLKEIDQRIEDLK